MPKSMRVVVTATEFAHFRRLVEFLEDVERLADGRTDVELQQMVDTAREDLLRLRDA